MATKRINVPTLEGWCVLWVRPGSTYATITSNVATLELARYQAMKVKEDGGAVLAVVKEHDLHKLPSLIVLCRELAAELDGARVTPAVAAIVNGMRALVEDEP